MLQMTAELPTAELIFNQGTMRLEYMDVFDKPEYNYLFYARNESFLMYKLCSNNSVRVINLPDMKIQKVTVVQSRFLMLEVDWYRQIFMYIRLYNATSSA